MSTKSSLRIQSDSCSIYAHTCWQVDCDKNLFSSFIVQNWLRKHPPVRTCTISRHVPFTFSSPQVPEVSSCYTGWHPWATAVLEAHSCSQEALSISKFTISVWHSSLARSTGALPEDCWHPNWHPSISSTHTWTILTWSTCALPTLTSDDSMCGNLSLILRIGSRLSKKSPICKGQRQGWTRKLPASTKTCYVDGDRDTSKILALELQGNLEEGSATYIYIYLNLEILPGKTLQNYTRWLVTLFLRLMYSNAFQIA